TADVAVSGARPPFLGRASAPGIAEGPQNHGALWQVNGSELVRYRENELEEIEGRRAKNGFCRRLAPNTAQPELVVADVDPEAAVSLQAAHTKQHVREDGVPGINPRTPQHRQHVELAKERQVGISHAPLHGLFGEELL